MAQHDYNIEDQNGFDFLVDLNNALSAIATNNAGSSEPNPTFPHMIWFDTNNDLMKVRNEANSAWVIVAKKDGSVWTPYHLVNPTLSGMTTTTRLRTTAGNNTTPTGTDHPYQIGLDAGANVRFDDNAIGAFDNGGGSRLTLNRYGGGVAIGSSGVAQDIRIFGQLTTTRLRTTAGNNATPTGTDHPYQIGLDTGVNLRFDDNAIGAFDNGVGSRLTLNRYGGGVAIGPISANSPEKLRVVEEVNNSMVAQFINSAGDSGDIHGKGYIGFGVSNSFEETGCYIGWDQESTSGYQQALTFGTRPDIEEFPAERMRITSGGDVQITKSLSVKGATLEPTGTAPMHACRAWVNFNGTGTVAIRASGNVSSITDFGVGNYRVNFTTAMEDADYSAIISHGFDAIPSSTQNNTGAFQRQNLAGSFTLFITSVSDYNVDADVVMVSIFR